MGYAEEGRASAAWWLKGMFLAGAPMALQFFIPTFWNFLGETRLPEGERGIQKHVYRKHFKLVSLSLVMGFCTLTNMLWKLFYDSWIPSSLSVRVSQLPMLAWTITISSCMIAAAYKLLPRMTAHANTYLFLASACYLQIQALDIYYQAPHTCVPDGPDFSNSYYITLNGVVGGFAGCCGVMIFQAVMGTWDIRSCFWVTTVVRATTGLIDVGLIQGWWRAIGIPDGVSFMLGKGALYQVCYMLDFMPGVIMTSKLCPKGCEAMVYALLAGFQNFGQNVSQSLAVVILPLLNVRLTKAPTPADPCNIDLLWLAVLIGETLLPLVTVPLTFWLLPDGKLRGQIYDSDGNPFPPDEEEEEEEDEEAPKYPVEGDDITYPAYDTYDVQTGVPAPTPASPEPSTTYYY